MNTSILPDQNCPDCGRRFERTTLFGSTKAEPGEPRPGPGDISICTACGGIMVLDEGLQLRCANLDDLMGLSVEDNAMLERGVKALRQMWASHGRP